MAEAAEDLVQRSEPRPGVVQLTLSRPDRLNALTQPLVTQFHEHLRALADDLTCRVVVLTGAGRGFCAGLDLGGFGTMPGTEGFGRGHQTWATQRAIAALVQEIRRLPQPVIAAVNGPAAGGGLALVCASDIRIASATAVFATSFIRIGVTGCDIGTSWLLPRLVGAARAHELMLTSRRFDAAEALRIGLVTDVVEPGALTATVNDTIDTLLQAPPLSLSLTKQGMWLALEIPSFDAMVEVENRQQVLTSATEDASEAMAAYVGHRPAEYQNR
ncbi:MAG TPA: enoyl-CoA hydratase/isomerase family protein [Streptosporangiaceae bacterium]|nr:enoyl-CoA hydratase/isomerase family protein [Streptosporangiaceae bacterium]